MLSKPAYFKPKKRVKPMKNALEEQKQLSVLSNFLPVFAIYYEIGFLFWENNAKFALRKQTFCPKKVGIRFLISTILPC